MHSAGSPDVEVFLARVRERKRMTGIDIDAAEIIAARDADRR